MQTQLDAKQKSGLDSPVSPVNININKQFIKRKSLDRKDFEVRPESRINFNCVDADGHQIKHPSKIASLMLSKSKLADDGLLKTCVISSLVKPRFQIAKFSIGKELSPSLMVNQVANFGLDLSRTALQTNTSLIIGKHETRSFHEHHLSSSRISREGRRTPSKSNVLIRYKQSGSIDQAENSYSKLNTYKNQDSEAIPN
jgi:hypothetical protein